MALESRLVEGAAIGADEFGPELLRACRIGVLVMLGSLLTKTTFSRRSYGLVLAPFRPVQAYAHREEFAG
ncbi:hypothetical protein GTY87_15900 [Streptomyces sp. SID7813]|uniref:Uncharacterized protein n=1 Tax=Streptomyces coelicolor (strain ATCC BAA-471 / A3(2) / M145) TaxID=100226 RepID=Q9F2N0_STRCO|nr:hypothetical protein [Streptomyces sp. SID7813]QFI43199.1 hypothetical protein FQ762_16040 [Streptomyces coelicolor A3(2)]CAC09561.1 hypothetical protein SCE41.29c [Streptomyces coelicolor A3(2)]